MLFKSFYLILVVLAAYTTAEGANTIDLTPDNFDSIIDGSKAAFVKFYAPVNSLMFY